MEENSGLRIGLSTPVVMQLPGVSSSVDHPGLPGCPHQPDEIAKRYGNLDRLSGGRLVLGVGVGWMPFGLTIGQPTEMLAKSSPPANFEVVLSTFRAVDPIGEPGQIRRRPQQLREAGATAVNCSVAAESADHFCRRLAALGELVETVEWEVRTEWTSRRGGGW